MRAVSCILILALIASSRAAFVVTDCAGAQATGNGVKCTDGTSTPQNGILTCKAGFSIVQAANGGATSCVATPSSGTGCTLLAPAALDANGAKTPNGACAASQPNAAPADLTQAWILPALGTTTATCTTSGADATKLYYTPSAVATAGDRFTATPLNSWMCLACPAGCTDCSPATGKALNPTNAAQTNCKTAATGYYLGTTADTTSGNFPITACPTAVSTTYGVNATTCSACVSTTNCTMGACPSGQVYLSYANLTGAVTTGLVAADLAKIDTANANAKNFQGCYKIADLQTWYPVKSSAMRMAVSAVIVAVAAVFAF